MTATTTTTGRRMGYARVSSRDQNPELQEDALTHANCDEIRTEKESAVKDRPVFDALLAELEEGDTLVFWKIDRIARSMRHLLEIVDDFAERKIHFHCLDFNVDTSTAQGKLVLTMMGAVSEFERSLLIERTEAGLAVARKNGKRFGPPPRFTDALAIDIRNAYFSGGMTMIELAAKHNCHRNTIYHIVHKRKIPFANMPEVHK